MSILAMLPVLLAANLAPQAHEPVHHLVLVRVRDAAALERVRELDLDLASCTGVEAPVRQLEVIATDDDLRRIRDAGFDYWIRTSNMEAAAARRVENWSFPQTLTPPVGQGAMGGHYTFAQIVAILDDLAKRAPKICAKKISLGRSHEGREIWAVKISDNVNSDENEPEVLYDALHHAREPVAATATLHFMDWLVTNYATNADAKFLVDNRELWFVPCVNPDGYEYNRSTNPNGGGMWRKNRRDNGGGVFGVDINRNWPTGWRAPHGGNSTNPSSSTYRGPAPLSEPETLALENFIKSRNFVFGSSTHTWSGMVLLHPWGYLTPPNQNPPNVAEYRMINATATAQNPAMRAGAASVLLYTAAGIATDHCHAVHGMFAYLPELGGGFWPNPTEQVRLANLHLPMLRAFARVAGADLRVDDATLSESSSGNGNRRLDPGESGDVVLRLANGGASATRTTVKARLRSLTNGVTVTKASHDFGFVAKFATISNDLAPFRIQVAPSFRDKRAKFEFTVDYEGMTSRRVFDLPFVTPRRIVDTDFEVDLGFVRGSGDTATTGRFERGVPEQTIYRSQIIQPAGDHTPGLGTQCWVTDGRAGPQAGAYDVDGGFTTLVSPLMDLRHVELPTLAFWLHYTESLSPQDPFTIELSTRPNVWTSIFSRDVSTNGWMQIELALPSGLTEKTRLRFTARDLTVSLVEACIDDLEIRGAVAPGSTTILGGGLRQTSVRLALRGMNAAIGVPLVSAGTGEYTIPGISGKLLLDPATVVALSPFVFGNDERVSFDVVVPNDAQLVGRSFYWQQLMISGTQLLLGNRTQFEVR